MLTSTTSFMSKGDAGISSEKCRFNIFLATKRYRFDKKDSTMSLILGCGVKIIPDINLMYGIAFMCMSNCYFKHIYFKVTYCTSIKETN